MKKVYAVWFVILLLVPVYGIASGESNPQKKHLMKMERVSNDSGGWLGVSISDVSAKLAKEKKLPSEEGACVQDVTDESPADSAGIREGDVIVELGGKKVTDADNLRTIVGSIEPGAKTPVILYRDGGKQTLSVVIGKRPRMMSRVFPHPMPMPECPRGFRFLPHHPQIGLDLETLNDQLGQYFGAPDNSGVLVREVEKKSLAEKAGFKAGDVIVRVGKKRVDDAGDVRRALSDIEPGSRVDFEVLRKGASKTIPVTIEKGLEEEGFYFEMPDIRIDKHEMMKLKDDMKKLKDELKDLDFDKIIIHEGELPEL